MKKRMALVITGVLAGVLSVVGGLSFAMAESTTQTTIIMTIDSPTMQVNGEIISIDENGTAPIVVDGRTMVPIRAVVEELGGEVSWDAAARTVTVTKDSDVISLTIDSNLAEVNSQSVELDTTPVIVNERTLLPLRFVSENLGAEVVWNAENRQITITGQNDAPVDETEIQQTDELTTEQLTTEQTTGRTEQTAVNLSDGKILIVYFTMPESDGVDTVAGASRVVVDGEMYGSVEFMANTIQETTGGDLFEIKTVQDYPTLHEPLVDLADEELANDARPELSTHIDNLDEYDTVFVGYPIWWGDMPMPLYSFFDEYDFSGKTIIPFSSHGGSRLANTVETIAELEPDAAVTDGFTVSRNDIEEDASAVAEELVSWVKELGF